MCYMLFIHYLILVGVYFRKYLSRTWYLCSPEDAMLVLYFYAVRVEDSNMKWLDYFGFLLLVVYVCYLVNVIGWMYRGCI